MQDPAQLAQLARSAAQRNDWAAAEQLMAQALALAPQVAPLHLNYGNILKQLGRLDAARSAYEHALYWQPDWADAHYNLGNLALAQHDQLAAAEHYRAAIRSQPDYLPAHYSLGTILTNLGQLPPAHQHFATVLQREPQHLDALHNLGRLYRREGRLDDARACYQQVLQLAPEHALARYSLGTLDLLQGHWAAGWKGYEARWAALGKAYPATPLPRWQGEAVAPEAKLLVIGEQGYGDMLQFARFLPQLCTRFAQVTVLVPAALQRLLQQSFPQLEIVSELASHAGFTHHIPYMSLAGALQISEADLSGEAYLQVDSAEAAQWQAQLAPGRKIGLAWQGNPQQVDNGWRSIALSQLAPVLAQPGIQWCSLQHGHTAPAPLRNDLQHSPDFAATAAYLQQLDLVITVCTSVAHLAGALGRPTLLLSRFDADWRWQVQRSDSPWYRSMQIIRQPQLGDWAAVVEQVRQGLAAKA
ncbi:tetratricopeptide repeat protein [Chitinibacter sp. ZOR0017]|uniref:tetratricopeptide repeat protein n=1 Tax=Chitinibacter sp. ZOR0017 TaxID=1339254 RepID=UPI0006490714|nr:tetratricopeptide repeat protein [Chitinibacter sp. ZOR0017]